MRPRVVIEPPALRTFRLGAALRRLESAGDLFWTLTRHRLAVRYKHTRLGVAWAIAQPLALMVVFTAMFSLLGRAPGGDTPYALFAYAGLVPWTAFASGLSSGTASLTGHAALLTKVYFPREILPFSYVAVALADLVAASLVLLLLMAWFAVPPTPAVLWVLPAVAVMTLFLAETVLVTSALNLRVRDAGIAMPVILQVWMFATPVLYPISMVERGLPAWLYTVYTLNPMAGVVETVRRAVLGETPDLRLLSTGAAVSLALLPPAYAYFKWHEATMADDV